MLLTWLVDPLVVNPGLTTKLNHRGPDVVTYAVSAENLARLPVILTRGWRLGSRLVPWGLVGNEALCHGLIVLASFRVTSSTSIEDGFDGLLFDPENDGELEAQLRGYVCAPKLRSQRAAVAATVDFERVVGVNHGVGHIEMGPPNLVRGSVVA